METKKCRTCGQGCVIRRSGLERMPLNGRRDELVAQLRTTGYFTGSSAGTASSDRHLSECIGRRYSGRKKTMR